MRFTDARALLFSIANELQRPSLALIRWSESLNQVIYNHLLLFVLVHKNKFNESAMDVWVDQHHYISVRFIVVGWEASGRDTGLLRTPSTDGQDYQHFLCFFFCFFSWKKRKEKSQTVALLLLLLLLLLFIRGLLLWKQTLGSVAQEATHSLLITNQFTWFLFFFVFFWGFLYHFFFIFFFQASQQHPDWFRATLGSWGVECFFEFAACVYIR